MVLRKWLELAIEDLKKDVNKMASLVTNNISNSLESFRTNNMKLALEIKKRDIEVDKLEDEIFFFQAEDGIRDRSPSRGLVDVYKRQVLFQLFLLTVSRQSLFSCPLSLLY